MEVSNKLEIGKRVKVFHEGIAEYGEIKMMIGYPPREVFVEIEGPGALSGYEYVHLVNDEVDTLNKYKAEHCVVLN